MYDPNMYHDNRRDVPYGQPDSYLSALRAVYSTAAYNVPPDRYSPASGASSDVPGLNHYPHTVSDQTIDQLIASGRLDVPAADPVAALLSDRQHTAHLSLTDALGQIRQRYTIYRHNMYDLELAKVSAINAAQSWFNPPGWKPEHDIYLMQTLESLSQMQREERVHLWQDVSRLRSNLPETIQMYLNAHRKMDLLSDRWSDDS